METILGMLDHPLAPIYISVAMIFIPAVRIYKRAGFSPWWVLLLLTPYVGYILCLLHLAFVKWPAARQEDGA